MENNHFNLGAPGIQNLMSINNDFTNSLRDAMRKQDISPAIVQTPRGYIVMIVLNGGKTNCYHVESNLIGKATRLIYELGSKHELFKKISATGLPIAEIHITSESKPELINSNNITGMPVTKWEDFYNKMINARGLDIHLTYDAIVNRIRNSK